MIGLIGSQRCGKTTLANAFAMESKIPFVRTSASEVFALLGKDPKIEYPIWERIAIQEAILFAFEKQYAQAHSINPLFIADRTPLDMAGYLLADVQRSTLTGLHPDVAKLVNDYVQRCLEATNRWFSIIILVQPGIKLVEADGKAPACPAFIEHFNCLAKGLMLDERLGCRHFVIPRRYTRLEDRIMSVKNAALHSSNVSLAERMSRESEGGLLH